MIAVAPVVQVWLATIVLDTTGQLAFKSAAVDSSADMPGRWMRLARNPRLWLGVACYVAEFLAWTAFLSLVPLGRGVLLGSINIVAVMLAGRMLFGERLTRTRLLGIGLVGTGVALVGAGL